ncbi:hypothetical protein RRG08_045373 [Elysia crispata]|uniref:Uncharacterized protein n=1 Tax=Elysia crispata TaxID=231223 RepID=A0AAE0YB41_9GAST|nr:hypothetical protein RRG08_045373 [Elysia crispata]
MRTGGGEAPKIPECFHSVMEIIGDRRAQLNGIEDTGRDTIFLKCSGRRGGAIAANCTLVLDFHVRPPSDTPQGVLAQLDPWLLKGLFTLS